jgi:hypothetical protein
MMPRLALTVPLLILVGVAVAGCKQQVANPSKPATTSTEVKLTIDTGDPKVTSVTVPYTEKMTVRDAFKLAEAQGITAEYKGEGAGAMLLTLQGISNQGGDKEAKNWIFYVNSKPANVSSAVYTLQPGDAIIWRFEKYE